MTVRISVALDRHVWCRLRRLAEERKEPRGRASVAAVVRQMLELALEKKES
jgi:hypothetical protein